MPEIPMTKKKIQELREKYIEEQQRPMKELLEKIARLTPEQKESIAIRIDKEMITYKADPVCKCPALDLILRRATLIQKYVNEAEQQGG